MVQTFRAVQARVLLLVLSFVVLAVSAARAQETVPAAGATAAPNATPVPVAAATGIPTPTVSTRKSERLDVSVTAVRTIFNGSDAPPNSPSFTDRLGWNLTYHLSPRWEIFYNRGNLDYQLGRELNAKGKAVDSAVAEDFIDTFGARYAISPDLFVGAGHYRRWHQCCPASGDPTNDNPAIENSAYFEVQDSFGPKSIIGHAFTVYMMDEIGAHKLSFEEEKALKPDEFVPPETLPVLKYLDFYFRFPIYHQNRVVPFLRLSETGTYFDSTLVPSYSNYVMYGLDIKGSQSITYQVNARDYTGHQAGALTPHYTWIQLSATYHGRFL